MMQAMGVPPTGQVAIGVAQRSVLQNPGGATGQLQGVGAPTQKRGLSRNNFRKEIAARQITGGNTGGTPTNGNNPVATQLLLAPTFTPVQAQAVLDQANMRIAVPVRQVDGEYILVMQMMGAAAQPAAPQAAPAGEAAPAAAQPAAAPAAQPAGAAPAAESTARPAEPAAAPASATPAAEASRPGEASPAAAGESSKPATESTAAEKAPTASESAKEPAGEAAKTESSAKPEASKAEVSPAAKPERRQEKTDKYGNPVAPQGAVVMSMKQVDEMASMEIWGGQAPITQMMNDYVKAQTGKGLDSPSNGTASASASAGGLTGITV